MQCQSCYKIMLVILILYNSYFAEHSTYYDFLLIIFVMCLKLQQKCLFYILVSEVSLSTEYQVIQRVYISTCQGCI